VERALTPATKLVIIESPSNPLLAVIDIRRVAAAARARGIVTIIDNTFATPITQQPHRLGIDVVVHSGTKYLGGHGDLCCGAALASAGHAERIRATARHLGGSVNALTCYLLERSLKTLALRVTRRVWRRTPETNSPGPRCTRASAACSPSNSRPRDPRRRFFSSGCD
jgi:cystathionine beta-lyase